MTTELQTNIAEEINFLFAQTELAVGASRSQADCAIEWAWKCGGKLNEQKAKLRHGEWLPWLEANCPTVPHRTATRYMYHASKYATVADLKAAIKAKAVSVLPEPPSPDDGDNSKPPPADPAMVHLDGLSSYLGRQKVDRWDDVTRQAWKERLEPLVKLHQRLCAA